MYSTDDSRTGVVRSPAAWAMPQRHILLVRLCVQKLCLKTTLCMFAFCPYPKPHALPGGYAVRPDHNEQLHYGLLDKHLGSNAKAWTIATVFRKIATQMTAGAARRLATIPGWP